MAMLNNQMVLDVSLTIYVPIVLSHFLRRTPTATTSGGSCQPGRCHQCRCPGGGHGPWIVRGSDHWIIAFKITTDEVILWLLMVLKKRELMIINGG